MRSVILATLLALASAVAVPAPTPSMPLVELITICSPAMPCPPGQVCIKNTCIGPMLFEPTPGPLVELPDVTIVPDVTTPPVEAPPVESPPVESPIALFVLDVPNVSPEPSAYGIVTPEPMPVTQVMPPPIVGTPPATPSPLPSPTRMPNLTGFPECAACVEASQCATGDCHRGKCVYTDFRFRGSVMFCFGGIGVPAP